MPGRKPRSSKEKISFNDDDLKGTTQPHDDTRVVTIRIKRVTIDQDNGAEIIYPHLYKGLGLKKEDLTKYDTPLVGFNGKIVMPAGHNHRSMPWGSCLPRCI